MEFNLKDEATLEKIKSITQGVANITPMMMKIISDGKDLLTEEQRKEVESKMPSGTTFESIDKDLNKIMDILNNARG